MPTRNVIYLSLALAMAVLAHTSGDRTPHGRRLGEIIAAVERSYIEQVDADTLFDAAVEGVMGKLDENSRYVSREDRTDFEASLDLEFCGVGLELVGADSGDGEAGSRRYLQVDGLLPESPAWKSGLSAGDSILAIDGVSTRGMTTSQAVARLRGRPGSRVVVTVAGSGTDAAGTVVRDVELVRETIRIESVLGDRRRSDGSWEWRIEGRPDLAFIRLTGFGEHTREDLERAIEQTLAEDRPAGVVLDLRGNPGGLVTSAVEVADLFLDSRELIVATRGRPASRAAADGGDATEAAPDRRLASTGDILNGLPMAVLVDGETASAAEIVAAALQDHARARIFGGRTFGKGTVQQILPLFSDGGLLKVTSSEYLRPSGKAIGRNHAGVGESWGVVPDVGLEVALGRDVKRRLAAWRRQRDLVRPNLMMPNLVRQSGVATALSEANISSLADAPEQVDPVLGRAVEWLTSLPAPRMPEKSSQPRR